MKEATSAWNMAQQDSSAESQLLAWSKKNKPCAVFEELVLPEAIALAQIMIDKKAADTLKTDPPSPTVKNQTKKHVSRRISNILANVVGQVANEVAEAGQKQWVWVASLGVALPTN